MSDTDWENFETCPDGFCRHWDCNNDCEEKYATCGHRCPDHKLGEHTECVLCDCKAWRESQ